jgi:hypothetical protein
MKIKVELQPGENLADAEELMEKALKAKSECDHGERYTDDAMNEAHSLICARFNGLLNNLQTDIEEILRDATGTKNT